jgi:hypothetical protein
VELLPGDLEGLPAGLFERPSAIADDTEGFQHLHQPRVGHSTLDFTNSQLGSRCFLARHHGTRTRSMTQLNAEWLEPKWLRISKLSLSLRNPGSSLGWRRCHGVMIPAATLFVLFLTEAMLLVATEATDHGCD